MGVVQRVGPVVVRGPRVRVGQHGDVGAARGRRRRLDDERYRPLAVLVGEHDLVEPGFPARVYGERVRRRPRRVVAVVRMESHAPVRRHATGPRRQWAGGAARSPVDQCHVVAVAGHVTENRALHLVEVPLSDRAAEHARVGRSVSGELRVPLLDLDGGERAVVDHWRVDRPVEEIGGDPVRSERADANRFDAVEDRAGARLRHVELTVEVDAFGLAVVGRDDVRPGVGW